jgi:Lrp/AsnC family transcriptional regulator, leucine-responsive regulatory protein
MRVLAPKTLELKLDKKDWRILSEYVANVRQPLSQIAKSSLLSRQSVEYRINQLKRNKLITGSRSVINNRKLGYQSYHIFVEVNVPREEKELIKRAEEAKYVNAIIVYSGKYNIEISIMARDDDEFLKYYAELVNRIKIREDHVLVLKQTVVSEVLPQKYFPELKKLHQEKNKVTVIKKSKEKEPKQLDKTDLKLLYSLSRDASITNFSLAKELNISKDTVSYRIQKLEREKYLIEYRPVINFSVLGLSINSLLIKLNYFPEEMALFEQHIKNNGSILWATRTFGYYDYLIYVITKDLEEFHEVINSFKAKFENLIKTYEILFAFEELKYNFMAESLIEDKRK